MLLDQVCDDEGLPIAATNVSQVPHRMDMEDVPCSMIRFGKIKGRDR